ncbi:hypothetical protein F3Y22_tig00110597pilonHSYRG00286 [Hibiscus syriacus]|uniref:Uncharacterized protein n=1 Tax=Hibiscus syriacus TaxID=106335 RepID=A0A6A3A358_HIBSY|nr:hypothetical protein F3Y22_tig00110597pilonHSYRG00286 [Hibiscus syriacus]
MDCALNDCSLFLKSANQREVYPALVLFPPETETALSYNGDISVTNIIIAQHGSNSHRLYGDKGISLTSTEGVGKNQDSPGVAVHEEDETAKYTSHEVILKNQNPKRVSEYNGGQSRSHISVVRIKPHLRWWLVQSLLPPINLSRWDALDQLGEGIESLKEAPLSFGVPVLKRAAMPFIALTRTVSKTQYVEVSPGIYFLDQFATEIGEGAWTLSNDGKSLDWPLN